MKTRVCVKYLVNDCRFKGTHTAKNHGGKMKIMEYKRLELLHSDPVI